MDADLIKINLIANTNRKVINELGQLMLGKNYVKKSYIDAVLKRESSLPTGLNIGNICVAIPHTDPVHVITPAIAVGILNTPVKFQSMISPDQSLLVKLVFMLAVKNPQKQVELLKKLMSLFKDIAILQQIEQAKDKKTIVEILEKAIS